MYRICIIIITYFVYVIIKKKKAINLRRKDMESVEDRVPKRFQREEREEDISIIIF